MSLVTDDLLLSIHGEKVAVPGIVHLRCKSCGESLTDAENTSKVLRFLRERAAEPSPPQKRRRR